MKRWFSLEGLDKFCALCYTWWKAEYGDTNEMEPTRTSCKRCGGKLNFSMEIGGIATCDSCGSVWTLPKRLSDPAALDVLRQGEAALDNCKFDEAFTSFQKASEYDNREPEVYFGMALARFKVQYLKDETAKTPRLQPVSHEISEKIFTRDEYFQRAITYATAYQREQYLKRGQEIDDIRSEFFKLKESGLDYDCFLCVKLTDDGTGQRTTDCDLANELYDYLRDNGFQPFFTERESKASIGSDDEALILYALCRSECMIVVCSDESYLHSKRMKNEYTRFAHLIADEEKENDAITLAFQGKPIERLPERSSKIQSVDLQKPDAFSLLARFVQHHTLEARAAYEAEELRQREQQERLRQQKEEQERAQKKLEERLKNLSDGQGAAASPMLRSLLVRAAQELLRKDYAECERYCKEALNIDPENGEAWLRLYLAETWKSMAHRFEFDGGPDGESVVPEVEKRLYDGKKSLMEFLEESLESQSFLNAELYGKDGEALKGFAEKSCRTLKNIRPAFVKEQEEIRAQGKAARAGHEKLQQSYRELLEKKRAAERKKAEITGKYSETEGRVNDRGKRQQKVAIGCFFGGAVFGFFLGAIIGIVADMDGGAIASMMIGFAIGMGMVVGVVGTLIVITADASKKQMGKGVREIKDYKDRLQQTERELLDIAREMQEAEDTIDDYVKTNVKKWESELQASIAYLDTLDKIDKKLQRFLQE